MTHINDSALVVLLMILPSLALAQAPAGQIVVDSAHPAWFKYQDGGPLYLCGPGDPEGFLYRGTRNSDGTRNGDQMTLINKLVGTGANCIYMQAIRSHGGDGSADHNPFVNSDVNGALDSDILNQWEIWFTAMDNSGIVIFFIFYDDSASPFGKELPTGGQLKSQEVTFINSMVARFKNHKHLIWCVAEEYGEGLSAAHAAKIAQQIKLQDDRQHPVAIHQNNGTSFDFNGNSAFNQFAVQWNVATAAELHAGTVAAWNNVGGMVNVNIAEFANAGTGAVLREKIWAIALGGGYAMILGMDIASTPVSDLQICGRLVGFMEATRFNEASPMDELAGGDTDYAVARPGEVYIAYGDGGYDFGLSMLPGNYAVKWYNPGTGSWVDQGTRAVSAAGSQLFAKPSAFAGDAALYVVRTVPALAGNPFPSQGALRVQQDVQLSWTAGGGATSQNVYFGAGSPGDFRVNQPETSFDPGLLEPLTTYYWRIDEVNEIGTRTGTVWSFTTDGVPGDMDGDGDVDQEDFGLFQACLTVPGDPIGPECLSADIDQNELVDQHDTTLFERCLSGPMVVADPGCAN
jgi:hypothetical protein